VSPVEHGAQPGEERPHRDAPPSTRQLIIEVAQREISEHGFNGVSLRRIARGADVDPSLVRHYFGSKQNLLAHAMQMDIDPHEVAAEVLRGSPGTVGRRVVATLLGYWDDPKTAPMSLAQLSATLNSAEVAQRTKDHFLLAFLGVIADAVSPDHHQLRAELAASQLIGLVVNRHLVGDPVFAGCSQQDLVRILGHTVQRYLTEPLPIEATGRGQAKTLQGTLH